MKTIVLTIAAVCLAACNTVTTTLPDGTVIVTKSADPATVGLIAAAVSDIARATVIAEK
jgi:hypothetical protein